VTRTISEVSPAGRDRTIVLDEKGRVVQVGLIDIHPTQFVYDGQGRLTTIRQGPAVGGPPERIYAVGYDPQQPMNRITSLTNPVSEVTAFSYDGADRVDTQTLPDLQVIDFGYDGNGNLDSLTPPGRPAHGFLFSGVNLTEQYTPPNVTPALAAPQTEYVYNLDRQLDLTKLPREGGESENEYEMDLVYESGTDRLQDIILPLRDGQVVPDQISYAYDSTTGQIETITGPDATEPVVLSYGYDGFLETSVTWSCVSPPCPAGTVEGEVTRDYDTSFRLVSEKVNGAHEATFEYDADDLLTKINVGGKTMTLTRDPERGGLITATAIEGVTDVREYNGFGEIERYEASYQGVPFYSYEIEEEDRDGLGRITRKTETIGGVTTVYEYTYDTRGRLDTVTEDGVTSDYGYDANGNRLTHHGAGGTLLAEGSYDAQDRLESYGLSGDLATYTYNPNGQLETKLEGSALTTYEYDALGNLRRVELPGGPEIEYVIDGRNRRIGKKVDGDLVQGFLYGDQLRIVAELNPDGSVKSRFVYGERMNVPELMIQGSDVYRIITDYLGSVRMVVDETSGLIVQRIDYDEFGNAMLISGTWEMQPFGFAGGLHDANDPLGSGLRGSGWIRFGGRDYEPAFGRWTSRDEILFNGGQTNLYGYVYSDPVNLVDFTGLQATPVPQPNQGPSTPSGCPRGGIDPLALGCTRACTIDCLKTCPLKRLESMCTVGHCVASCQQRCILQKIPGFGLS
jgi:RHS repeat-associated protein